MVLQPFLFINCSLMPHSTADGCLEANVDINITGPKMEDIFLNRKGTLVCQVKANKPSVEKIYWEYENGQSIARASKTIPKGSKGPFSLPLEISYDEWSKGIKLNCIVEHSECIDPLKKLYQRDIGKKTIQQLCTKSLCLISRVVPSNM